MYSESCVSLCFVFQHESVTYSGRSSRIRSSRMITITTPAGPIFFCTPPLDHAIFVLRPPAQTGSRKIHLLPGSFLWYLASSLIYCSVNRVILANVYIICIIINRKIGAIRNIGKCLIFGRSNLYSLFRTSLPPAIRFLCPLTCHDIISYTVFHQDSSESCGKLLMTPPPCKNNTL